MSTAADDDIESGLAAISDALTNASTCFDVWREMQDETKRTVYEPVVEEYPIFFETTVVAHLIAMSTLLYPILETRRDTHNIPTLIRTMREATNDVSAFSNVEARVDALRPTWAKLARVRNKVFGHQSNEQFRIRSRTIQLELSPDDIGRLIEEFKAIVRVLAGIAGTIVSDALTLSATEDTERLMLCLAERHAPLKGLSEIEALVSGGGA